MRRRMIDPSFWDDESLGVLGSDERLLFIACISNADDEGRLKGSPESLKKIVFGFQEVAVEQVRGWLDNLCAHVRGLVQYESEGRQYLALLNWSKYQTIERPTRSIIPAPLDESSTDPLIETADSGMTKDEANKEEDKHEVEHEGRNSKETKGGANASPPAGPSGDLLLLEFQRIKGKAPTRSDAEVCRALMARGDWDLDIAIHALHLCHSALLERGKGPKQLSYYRPAIVEALMSGLTKGGDADANKRKGAFAKRF